MATETRPTRLGLGNDFDIHFEDPRVRGVIDPGISFRGFIGADRDSAGPIHASLSAPAVWDAGRGLYYAPILGADLTAHLTDYLYDRVWIIGESVPPGSYREAFPVTVSEDQGE